jgi:hypothetical protein
MDNRWLIAAVVILALIIAYFGGLWQNTEKIHRAELAMENMKTMRDSLKSEVRLRNTLQSQLRSEISVYKNEANTLRDQVKVLEKDREEKQFSVRSLRKKEDLQARLQQTFPEMASSDWGVTEIRNEKSDLELEYIILPLWFSETFIIDHQNAESWKKQKDKLLIVDTLNGRVIALQDSIYKLEHMNRQAYEKGFNTAYSNYSKLNSEYIKDLKKSRLTWALQPVGLLGGGVAGYVIGKK